MVCHCLLCKVGDVHLYRLDDRNVVINNAWRPGVILGRVAALVHRAYRLRIYAVCRMIELLVEGVELSALCVLRIKKEAEVIGAHSVLVISGRTYARELHSDVLLKALG